MNNRSVFDSSVRVAAVAAAFAVSACASAKPASSPSPAKPAHAAPLAAAAAAPVPSSPAPVTMPTGRLTRVGGIVVSVDAGGRAVTIKDYSGRTRTFRIADGARMTKGGDEAAIGLDGFAAGSRVRLMAAGDVAASAHMMVQPAR